MTSTLSLVGVRYLKISGASSAVQLRAPESGGSVEVFHITGSGGNCDNVRCLNTMTRLCGALSLR